MEYFKAITCTLTNMISLQLVKVIAEIITIKIGTTNWYSRSASSKNACGLLLALDNNKFTGEEQLKRLSEKLETS